MFYLYIIDLGLAAMLLGVAWVIVHIIRDYE